MEILGVRGGPYYTVSGLQCRQQLLGAGTVLKRKGSSQALPTLESHSIPSTVSLQGFAVLRFRVRGYEAQRVCSFSPSWHDDKARFKAQV